MQKHQQLVADPFSILVNSSKQPLHERNSFENNIKEGYQKNL